MHMVKNLFYYIENLFIGHEGPLLTFIFESLT